MPKSLATRNETIDVIKLVASYMVVFIHVLFYGNWGHAICAVARFAVPFFFLSSGYFSYNDNLERIKNKGIRILKLYLPIAAFYVVAGIVFSLLNGETQAISESLKAFTEIKSWIKFFVFNETVSSFHLWFLPALVYVYIMHFFIKKFKIKESVVLILSVVFLVTNLLLGEVLSAFRTNPIPIYCLRNFLLLGFPFFEFGCLAKKYQYKLSGIKTVWFILSLVAGIAVTLASRFTFSGNELYTGSILIVFALVGFSLKYSDKKYNKFIVLLSSCSTYIYLFHWFVRQVVYEIAPVFNIQLESTWFLMLCPIIVCFLTTVLSLGINFIQHKTKSKKL